MLTKRQKLARLIFLGVVVAAALTYIVYIQLDRSHPAIELERIPEARLTDAHRAGAYELTRPEIEVNLTGDFLEALQTANRSGTAIVSDWGAVRHTCAYFEARVGGCTVLIAFEGGFFRLGRQVVD